MGMGRLSAMTNSENIQQKLFMDRNATKEEPLEIIPWRIFLLIVV